MRGFRVCGPLLRMPARPPSLRVWFWPLALAVLIFAASSRARVASPRGIPHVDKIAHFMVYGLLGTLVCRTQRLDARGAAGALVIASLYGVSDELHQSFVPGRTLQLADWIADTCGAALAIGLYWRWTRYRELLETPVWSPRAGGAPGDDAPASARS